MKYLTAHFTLEELIESDYAVRHDIDNTPPADVLPSLEMLATELERVRNLLSVPVHVTSGYRSPKLNSAIGGAWNSQHVQGLAADIKAPLFGTPRDVANTILDHEDYIQFDQLILEGNWVHISFTERPRGDVLTASFSGGRATYMHGIV